MRFLIGFGSGRCGTNSLAALLSRQPSVRVGHELPPILPWQISDSFDAAARLRAIADRHAGYRVAGDVALYYLRYLPALIDAEPGLRAIGLRRDRRATVESYYAKVDGINHWSDRPWKRPQNVWSPAYPTYHDLNDVRVAIGRYWDEYYGEAERLAARYPGQVAIFPTEALNAESGVEAILDFAGIPATERVHARGVQTNRLLADRSPLWRVRKRVAARLGAWLG